MATESGRSLLQSLSDQEANRLVEAMKDPQFAALFADYMKEISDPRARRDNDLYLQQLEQQQGLPEGMALLKPSPLFCIKACHEIHGKLFVNVCTSDLIDRPSSVKCDRGITWNFPYTPSKQRTIILPRRNQSAIVIDVSFHSSISSMISDKRIRQLIESSALDGAEKVVDLKFGRPYRVLSKVKCKDGPPAIMRIGGTDKPEWKIPSDVKLHEPNAEPIADKKTPPADNSGFNLVDSLVTEQTDVKPVPRYEIIQRDSFQLQDCTVETPLVTTTRPTSIIVKIYLPEVDSLSNRTGVLLDAGKDRMTFEIKGLYSPLEIRYPFEVDHDGGRAKFSCSDRILSVCLPVVQKEPILRSV